MRPSTAKEDGMATEQAAQTTKWSGVGEAAWTWALAVVALSAILVSQRLDAALSTITSIRDVAGDKLAEDSAPGRLPLVWTVVTLIGVVAVWRLRGRLQGDRGRLARNLVTAFLVTWVVSVLAGLAL